MAIDCTREQWQWIAKICNCRQYNPINYIKEIGICEHTILLHQRKILFMHNTLY